MNRAILDLAHDLASLAAVVTFVGGFELTVMAFAPAAADGHGGQSAACELASAEPTDFNIEMCTGEPISLAATDAK